MKKHLVLLFGLFLALAFMMPCVVVAADIEFGPPDIVVGQVNMDDVLMDFTYHLDKCAISFDTNQLQSRLGCTEIDIGPHAPIGFKIAPPAMLGHLGGVHSSPFG